MGTGAWVALGFGALALLVVGYFVVKGTSTAGQAKTPAGGNTSTVGQVAGAVGSLATFGTALTTAYDNSQN